MIESQKAPADTSTGRILVRGVSRRFGRHVALHPTELTIGEVGRGSVTGLLGPNGSGKSTLLRILVGLIRPDAGGVSIDGVDLVGDGTAIRERCSYSPGELSLYVEMRGAEHLRWFLRGREADAAGRAISIAERLGLPLAKTVRTYSHGMKRLLVFAAALAPKVPVRVLDEPTDGLDPHKRAEVLDLLKEDARSGTTILLSSHHLGEVDRACETMVFLSEGRVLAVERAAEVAARARRSVRMSFAEDANMENISKLLAGSATVNIDGQHARVEIADADPRAFLSSLGSIEGLPAPLTLEYGSLSLEDLYRDLYGVEGI